jgi:hypothetical protein
MRFRKVVLRVGVITFQFLRIFTVLLTLAYFSSYGVKISFNAILFYPNTFIALHVIKKIIDLFFSRLVWFGLAKIVFTAG